MIFNCFISGIHQLILCAEQGQSRTFRETHRQVSTTTEKEPQTD